MSYLLGRTGHLLQMVYVPWKGNLIFVLGPSSENHGIDSQDEPKCSWCLCILTFERLRNTF